MQHPSLFAQSLLLLLPPALTLAGPGDLPPGAIPLGGPGGPAGPPGGAAVPPKVEPTKLDNFTWTDPFSRPDRAASHRAACESARTFAASEHQLHDLSAPAPAGLQAYGGALKGAFGGRPYPGGWDGVDAHGYERTLLRMEWGDVPSLVRRWVRAQEQQEGDEEEEEGEAGEAGTGRGKGLFAVFDKPGQGKGEAEAVERTVDWSASEGEVEEEAKGRVVVFAPGAIYETLPLWVAEGSECEGTYKRSAPE